MEINDVRQTDKALKAMINLFGGQPISNAVQRLIEQSLERSILLPKDQTTIPARDGLLIHSEGSLTVKGVSFAEMIQKGNYTSIDPAINKKNFPIKPRAWQEKFKAISFENGCVTSGEVVAELKRMNLRAAGIEVLLGFGALYSGYPKNIRDEIVVISLGSVWTSKKGNRYVVRFRLSPCERSLDCVVFERRWEKNHYFLATCE